MGRLRASGTVPQVSSEISPINQGQSVMFGKMSVKIPPQPPSPDEFPGSDPSDSIRSLQNPTPPTRGEVPGSTEILSIQS